MEIVCYDIFVDYVEILFSRRIEEETNSSKRLQHEKGQGIIVLIRREETLKLTLDTVTRENAKGN